MQDHEEYPSARRTAREPEPEEAPGNNALITMILVILAISVVGYAVWSNFNVVSKGIVTAEGPPAEKGCLSVSDLSANTAGGYRSLTGGAAEAKKFQGQATVFTGNVYNRCNKRAGQASIQLIFDDENGVQRTYWTTVTNLEPMQMKPFEVAIMGRLSRPRLGEVK